MDDKYIYYALMVVIVLYGIARIGEIIAEQSAAPASPTHVTVDHNGRVYSLP